MKYALAVILLALAPGCYDPEVSREQVGGESHRVARESCSHIGYCFTLMPGFDGKMGGSFKLSPYCPGSKDVEEAVTRYRAKYKSEEQDTVEVRRWIRDVSTCS